MNGNFIALVVIAGALGGAGLYGHHKGVIAGDAAGYKRGHKEAVDVQDRWDADRARMTLAANQAEAQHVQETSAMKADQEKTEHDAQTYLAQRDAARRTADDAHRGLLDAARQAAAAADSSSREGADRSTALAGGVGAGSSAGVFVPVLDGLDGTAGELADYADALRGSLRSCRAEYASVMVAVNGH